jgi:hypothetical protein
MILTSHILSGAALGANIRNPYLAAASAVALHFILDLFPHGDYLNKKSGIREFWKVAIDLFFGFAIIGAILLSKDVLGHDTLQNVLIGIFFSLLPDGITFLYWKMGIKFLKPIYDFHQNLHRAPEFSPEREFRLKNNPWDILVSFMCLLILLLI